MKANVQIATQDSVSEGAHLLAQSEVIVCYSDSIYILCANIHSEAAIKRIFELKRRDHNQPLQFIVDPKDAS
jgi:tRNA A37 threonylcarbamoyladenosine synthetase subunit TsaC/SUA5/YrdC